MKNYEYKVFAIDFINGKYVRRFIEDISANSPSQALKKAHLDNWYSIKSRAGRGYTNTSIKVYTLWYEGREKQPADFVMERQF